MNSHKNHSNARIECLRTNKHIWSSTAGGYWCSRCKLVVEDSAITKLRQAGVNAPLDELIKIAAESAEKWVISLHAWSEPNEIV